MGIILEVKYKFGAWQILYKKNVLNFFLSHIKYGRKIKMDRTGETAKKGDPFGFFNIHFAAK